MALVMPALLLAAQLGGAVVVKPVANLYSRPSEDADVVSQAIYGANAGVLEEHGGWTKVRTADGYSGWTAPGALRSASAPYAASGRVAQVESLFAHIYREPSVTRRQPLLTVPYETRLEAAGEQQRWIETRLPDGRTGWIQRGDVNFEPKLLSIAETIGLAMRFLGLPYTWGGTSSFGYDCSGFMQMLARRRGFSIPRDAQPQAYWSRAAAVEKEKLRAGDLVYFGMGLERISHTGMYIGDGRFIHATSHERPVVQISRLDDPHWSEAYVCARRFP